MKVLVIKNSESFLSGLDLILKHFLTGLKRAGAEYEVVNLNMMDIKACRLCTEDLTFDDNGRCQCDDDMQLLYPKLKEYENWVIATPFTGKIPGKLINFLDRLGPLFESNLDDPEVHLNGNIALISTTAHYESDSFGSLSEHFEDFTPVVSKRFTGSIARPHAPALDFAETDGELIKEVLSASERLGKQFANSSSFNNEDLQEVSRAIITKMDYKKINENMYN